MSQENTAVAVRSDAERLRESLQQMVEGYRERAELLILDIEALEAQLAETRRAESAARTALVELTSGVMARRG